MIRLRVPSDQTIDVEAGTLENVVQFAQGSSLTVESTFDPDESITNRFNFRFRTCEVHPPDDTAWYSLYSPSAAWSATPIWHAHLKLMIPTAGSL